jgi:hypothetical protein
MIGKFPAPRAFIIGTTNRLAGLQQISQSCSVFAQKLIFRAVFAKRKGMAIWVRS